MDNAIHKRRTRVHVSAWMISLAIHVLIALVLGALTWVMVRPAPPDRLLGLSDADVPIGDHDGGGGGSPGRSDPSEQLAAGQAAARRALQPPTPPPPAALGDALAELAAPSLPAADHSSALADVMQSLAGGRGSTGSAPGGISPGFGREIDIMRRRGLDVVLILDATDSMLPVIEEAKQRLDRVINVVTHMVPNARFAVVAFKDYGDEYGPQATHVHPLTDDHEAVEAFLRSIRAGGGGDDAEPIDEALAVAVHRTRLGWRLGARRVIVLVGDAPVHPSGRNRAMQAARHFRSQGGRINTIDVNARGETTGTVLADLQRIAAEGGGAAFSLGSEDAFWRHLIISVFGEEYAQDVNTIIERVVEKE